MIIDCHTHYGAVWVDKYGDDASHWLEIPAYYGIEKFFVYGHYNMMRSDRVADDHDRLARLAQKYPEKIIPAATVWPQFGQAAVDEIYRCVNTLGIKLLKFHPWLQSFSLSDPQFKDICDLAGELNVPIIFHDGTPPYALSEQIGGLARCFPRTTFVLGHGGILWAWRSALETMNQPNVWMILCGQNMRAMEIACERLDSDRLLWGTDYGFGFFDSISYRLTCFQRSRIKDGTKEKILGINPLRLIQQI
jgi:uncharacterized protein